MFQIENGAILGWSYDACDIVLSVTIKWTGPLLYKQQLAADQRIFPKRGESKPEGIRYLPL